VKTSPLGRVAGTPKDIKPKGLEHTDSSERRHIHGEPDGIIHYLALAERLEGMSHYLLAFSSRVLLSTDHGKLGLVAHIFGICLLFASRILSTVRKDEHQHLNIYGNSLSTLGS